MFATRLLLCALTCAQAQVAIEKVAGSGRHSGEYAWEMGIHSAGTAWDTEGNAYLGDFNRIWKLRPDGIAEVLAGTGEGGTAGTGADRYSGEGGPASQAKFSFPWQVWRDASGQLFFMADHRILRVGTNGAITTVAGNGLTLQGGMATEGRVENVAMNSTGKFAIDPKGDAYFYDFWLVRRADTAGNVTVIAAAETCPYPCGGPTRHIYPPNTPKVHLIEDLDIHPKTGEVYITEETDSSPRTIVIHKLSSGGTLTRLRELPNDDFSFIDMAVDRDANVFIAWQDGSGGARIQKLDRDLSFPATAPDGFVRQVLFHDPEGRVVYVNGMTVHSAEDGAAIRTYPDGVMHPSPDGTSALESKIIGFQNGLAVNRAGEIYFTEPSTCRIRKFDRQKMLRTVFGLDTCNAEFPDPLGIAFGPDDRLWVSSGQRVWVSTSSGGFTQVVLPPGMRGTLVAVDSKGRLHLAQGGRVTRMELDGTVSVFRDNLFTCGLGTDTAGNVYFSDPMGIWRIEEVGEPTRLIAGDYGRASKFAMDAQGRPWWRLPVAGDPTGDVAIAPNGDIYAFTNPYIWGGGPYLLEIFKRTEIAPRVRPLISAAGVVNGASYAGNAVSPGELVSIFGDNFGVTGLQVSTVTNNHLPTKLGPVKVTFNGVEGAITAATAKQINVFVPSTLEPSPEVKIKVFVDEEVSDEITLPVVDTLFGLSSLDQSGKGQGAILNANGTVNSRGNPAQRGSLIVLFGTGEGKVYPDAGIGAVNVAAPYPKAVKPLFVRIGGQQTEIVFAGGAPTLAQGVYQINARVPMSVPPGDVTVEVVAEGGATSRPVTVAVQ